MSILIATQFCKWQSKIDYFINFLSFCPYWSFKTSGKSVTNFCSLCAKNRKLLKIFYDSDRILEAKFHLSTDHMTPPTRKKSTHKFYAFSLSSKKIWHAGSFAADNSALAFSDCLQLWTDLIWHDLIAKLNILSKVNWKLWCLIILW